MNLLLLAVVVYPMALLSVSLWRSRTLKGTDEFMVAGRSVPVALLVGTLVCTWIGSGSLFGGAGLAYRTGIAELGVDETAHLQRCIDAIRGEAERLGL